MGPGGGKLDAGAERHFPHSMTLRGTRSSCDSRGVRTSLFRDSVSLVAEDRLLLERRLWSSDLSGGALLPRRAMAMVARANQLSAGLSATLPLKDGTLVQGGTLSPDVTTCPVCILIVDLEASDLEL